MPLPFPDGPTKGYLMERARARPREREEEGEGDRTRRRRSAIINSARSFLSIVIGVGRGRASLDGRAYSRYYLSFSPVPLVHGLAIRESQPRTRTR